MRSAFLGKVSLRWCDTCHTPVLARKCSCGAATREVPVTPPGDARPAFPADIELINIIFTDHFGAPIVPEGHLVLMNKAPDLDRMEEIIIGGSVIGSIRYLPELDKWEPIPRPQAAVFIKPTKRYVVVDDGAVSFIREGASVLAPGLVEIEDSVQEGDEVFILTREGTCVGVGRAKVSAETARQMGKGSVVRTRKNIPSTPVPGSATWDDAVRANKDALEQTEAASIHFVKEVAQNHDEMQKTISYSGGKDSLATLLVVLKAIGPHPLLFADTGLEFPETYENVSCISEKFGLQVIRGSGEEAFWKVYEHQGPPAVNHRWCCQVCKLTPVSNAITKSWGECLSFVGQRKYESLKRMMSGRVWKNPKVPNQIAAAPIHHWSALHVWLYIFQEKAPYNVLYERRLDRIGCFMCPSSDIALIRYIQKEYPDLWRSWETHLIAWQQKNNLPEEWISMMRWRLREGNPDEVDSNC